MLRDASNRTATSKVVVCADGRVPRTAVCRRSTGGRRNERERALSSPALCQAHARSPTQLCATFASAIITTTSPSRIPSFHQELPILHQAWLSKSRHLPVTAPRAHPRASDKGETEGASGGAGSTCRKKDKKKKDEDETGAGKQ